MGLRALYFGANSQTTKIIGSASMAATWTLTLPANVGTIGQFLVDSGGSGTSAWRYPEKTTTKTSNYTATGDESVILCDTSGGSFTITLPASSSFAGKHYIIKKTTSDANIVTIDANSTETIDGGLTKTLNILYESIKIVCDGSNWHISDRYNDVVDVRYHNVSGASISGSLSTINWATKDYDSHSAMSSGTYTVPHNGHYRVTVSLAHSGSFALNNQIVIQIQKNGTVFTEQDYFAFASVSNIPTLTVDTIPCSASDTIRVQVSSTATTPGLTSSDTRNYIVIEKVK